MSHVGLRNLQADLSLAGIKQVKAAFWNLSPAELVEAALHRNQGTLSDSGSLVIKTGAFTGRAPKDKFIVLDSIPEKAVGWGGFNTPVTPEIFDNLHAKVVKYLED